MALVRKLNEKDLHVRSGKKGFDPIVDKIIDNPDCEEAKLHRRGIELRDSKLRRSYMEACLLGSDDFDKIAEILELPVEFVKFYEEFFYNVSCLDRLERLELLEDETDTLKLWALSQGLDFIAWRLGKPIKASPIVALQDLFNTCLYRSKEAMFNRNASEASREAIKWTKLSMDIARLLKLWTMDSEAARKDLELALEKVIPDFGDVSELDIENLDQTLREFQSMQELKKEEEDKE